MSLDWTKLEKGGIYQFEDKYHIQAYRVVILDKEYQQNGDYIRVKIEVLEPKHDCEKGYTDWFGKHLMIGQYLTASMKFKPIGSMFDYMVPGDSG